MYMHAQATITSKLMQKSLNRKHYCQIEHNEVSVARLKNILIFFERFSGVSYAMQKFIINKNQFTKRILHNKNQHKQTHCK